MASGTGIKEYFGHFSNAALASAAGTVLGGAFLAWWNWAAVKASLAHVGTWLAGIGAWLMGSTEVYRVVMLADFLVLAALLVWAVLWWRRSRASAVPVGAPKMAPMVLPPHVPADFKPTLLQVTIILALMQRWQQQTTLQVVSDLVEEAHPEQLPETMVKAHVARELELLEVANVVSIDRLGAHHAYYHLTPLGRDWAIQRLEYAAKNKAAKGK